MLSFSGGLRVFVAIDPCDMRKGFNGLYALVTERLGEEPRNGALFVFTNQGVPSDYQRAHRSKTGKR